MHDMIDHWLKGELPMCTDSKGKNHTSPIGGLVSHTIHQHSSPIFQTWLNSAASEQFKRFNMPFFIHLYHHSSSHLSDFWSCCQNVIVGDNSMPEIVDLKTAQPNLRSLLNQWTASFRKFRLMWKFCSIGASRPLQYSDSISKPGELNGLMHQLFQQHHVGHCGPKSAPGILQAEAFCATYTVDSLQMTLHVCRSGCQYC